MSRQPGSGHNGTSGWRKRAPQGAVSPSAPVKDKPVGHIHKCIARAITSKVAPETMSTHSPPPPPPPHPPSHSPDKTKYFQSVFPEALPKGPLPPEHYVASREDLEMHNYPLPHFDPTHGCVRLPEGFISTHPSTHPSKASCPLIAVDCEMCITAQGFELTRATLVDHTGKVLLDELVVPTNPILDYNTRFSGITAEMLANCKTTLVDIQRRVTKLVHTETLLVGHALENDLRAMKIVHGRVLDTSILFPHPRGPPFKSALKVLAMKYLQSRIQDGSHDSITDARTALHLVLLKLRYGPTFGTEGQLHPDRPTDLLYRHGDSYYKDMTSSGAASHEAAARTAGPHCMDDISKQPGPNRHRFLWGHLLGIHRLHQERAAAAVAVLEARMRGERGQWDDTADADAQLSQWPHMTGEVVRRMGFTIA